MTSFPGDLFRRFMSTTTTNFVRRDDKEEEIELSLGLSLNGRFGVDPRAKKLIRSSSIPDIIKAPETKDNDTGCVIPMGCPPLMRTCSLPTETEEEWRRRKELQTLRRMEAKRKRSEKQRNLKAVRDRYRHSGEENCEEDKKEDQGITSCNEILHCAVPSWVNGSRVSGGVELKTEKPNGLLHGVAEGLPPAETVVASQGSNGSQGIGSSGISEFDSHQAHGTSSGTEVRSPVSVQSLPENGTVITKAPAKSTEAVMSKGSSKPTAVERGVKNVARNMLEDMPCVSTKGDGPNGRRVEGFLYRYRKGEEVRIVCVCHGNFLSPAEFVKHAGGGDVAHPLKHIVVNPSPLL
ncbi:ninja-family protein AFP3-like [Carica papaya]|uniref:ninja-family protein AFP3-like n=1 Tax=Carica papaya TaxID=3649 RepID=UPI000B8C70D5|nr:ninja-family protein AFP3-like [Carica papaya]